MTNKNKAVSAKEILTNPIHFLAFGFGSGLAPKAPGTMGTLVAVPIYLAMTSLPMVSYIGVTLIVIIAGFWICDRSSKLLGVHDHSGIVWDEIAGYLVTMLMAPAGWEWMLAGFLLFRFFDVVKPPPIGWLDKKIAGGFGIMLDDIVAGIFAFIVMRAANVLLLAA